MINLELQVKNKNTNENILIVTEDRNIIKDYYVGFVDELKDIAAEYYPGSTIRTTK